MIEELCSVSWDVQRVSRVSSAFGGSKVEYVLELNKETAVTVLGYTSPAASTRDLAAGCVEIIVAMVCWRTSWALARKRSTGSEAGFGFQYDKH